MVQHLTEMRVRVAVEGANAERQILLTNGVPERAVIGDGVHTAANIISKHDVAAQVLKDLANYCKGILRPEDRLV